MAEERCVAAEELLRMPTDDKSHANAKSISNQYKSVRRESGKWLFRHFIVSHYGILNQLWTVGVVRKILTQPRGEMPDTYDEKSKNDCPSKVVKRLPQMRLDHRHKKRRKK